MKTLLVRFLFLTFAALGWIIYWAPFALKRAVASVLAWIFYGVLGFRRRIVLHNLAVVFPRTAEESNEEFQARCEKLAAANYRHYMLCFLEIFERFHWTEKDLNRRFRVRGGEDMRKHFAEGRGFFFLTAHIGNWELITRAALILKFPLAIVTKYLRNSVANELWVLSRKRYGLELLDEEGSGLKIMRAIRNKRAVGFILDQHIGPPHGIEARFMNLPAYCPRALAVLSSRLACPVVPAYLLRESDGTFSFVLESDLDFSSVYDNPEFLDGKQLTDAGVRAHIDICNKNIEGFVQRYPDQYLWLHKRFKNFIDYRGRLPWEL